MKRAVLELSDVFLISFLKTERQKERMVYNVENGLPDDVKVIAVGHN